ncbi:MAG: type II secretion system F family protein [Chloroflexi bacterium]|nr:type II secretion system F family protein [Chloroflexota bacterium]
MVYVYIAYSEKEELVKGKLAAASEVAAAEALNYAGYQVVSLKPFVPFFSIDKLFPSLYRVKTSEIILFFRELALLLESGIDVVTSLDLLQSQMSNRTLKRICADVISELRSGNQLSSALDKFPAIFPSMYCRLLAIGEQSGNLEAILRQMADYMEKEVVTAKQVKGALTYPLITFGVAIVVVGILVTFVLPTFSKLYVSLGVQLPLITRIVIGVAEKTRAFALHIILGTFVTAAVGYAYVRTAGGRYNWDRLLLRIPIIGRVVHLNELTRYCRSMSLLVHAGLPLTEILPLVVKGSGNKAMAKALLDVQQDMVMGEGLSRPMSKSGFFPPMMVRMVKVGEETGNLDTTLLTVAKTYETDTEDRVRSLIALIQPALTLVTGVVVGLIALSLSAAMYSIYGQGF